VKVKIDTTVYTLINIKISKPNNFVGPPIYPRFKADHTNK